MKDNYDLKNPRKNPYAERMKNPIVDAAWDAIITPEESDRLRVLLGDESRRTAPRGRQVRRHVLAGIARCGTCDGPLRAAGAHGMLGCHNPECRRNILVKSTPLEGLIGPLVLRAYENGGLDGLLEAEGEDAHLDSQLADVERRLGMLAARAEAEGWIDAEYRARRQVLKDRYDELKRRHERRLQRFDVSGLPPLHRLRTAWEDGTMDVAQKRALVSLLIESFPVMPGTQGHFKPERVPFDKIVWRDHVPKDARRAAVAAEVPA